MSFAWRWHVAFLVIVTTIAMARSAEPTPAGETTVRPPSPIVPRSNVLTPAPWNGVDLKPLSSAELDKLLATELRQDHISPAPRTSDEAFLRRVSLDLTGRLPSTQELRDFVSDRTADKREKVVDKLLASDAFARRWAKYWRDVISAKYTDRRVLAMVPELEKWLTTEFRENNSWRDIVRSMLTAEGGVAVRPPVPGNSNSGEPYESNGASVFLLAHLGEDQTEERAAETSRVFLGIQIQCAQCHDHPFDAWKQRQFHELAGYFARLRSRPFLGQQGGGQPRIELMSIPFREHRIPDKSDPTRGTPVSAKFLNGDSPRPNAQDRQRRTALADDITSPDNFWFAAAFVNRMWSEMMGQAFAQPVDDMGPGKDVYLPAVLTRVAASFRATDYDIKRLLRTICNSEMYQRQIRPGLSTDEHLHFAAAYPKRLPAEALWQSLTAVLGSFGPPADPRQAVAAAFGANRRPIPLEMSFLSEYRIDPSAKPDEVEGSIPQALLLMNNRDINRRLQATGIGPLGDIVKNHPREEDAVRTLYSKALSRKPTDHELSKAVAYVHKAGKREEAYEDLLWALINSTEFQTKR
jgi:hypothetical protein